MKKTIKTIALKDIKLTGDFIIHLREKHGTGLEFGKEMARLTGLGVLQKGEMPKVSEEKLKKLMLEGRSIFEDEIESLEDSMRVEGYLPKKHSYLKVFRDDYLVDGGKRLYILKRLFGEDYEIEVEKLTE
tara:strand:- start:10465 stop:10854 length:390 start_codon:yes stop_codon:yes gene_type:complete